MRPTSTKKPDGIVENWFHAHFTAQRAARFIVRPSEVANLFNLIWPVALDYYSPISPAFFCDCVNPNYMNSQPVWLIRDGLVPLLWFFRTYPEPGHFKSRLLVQADLAPFVPTAWRKLTGTYRLGTHPKLKTKKPETILIAGLMMETFCSVRAARKILDDYVARRKPGPKTKVVAFLPFRNDSLSSERRHEFHGEFMQEVMKRFGTDIKFINYVQFDGMDSFEGYEALDLNERLVCSDSYLMHSAMSRGAHFFEAGKPAKNEQFVELSRYHGFFVKPTLDGAYALGPQMSEFGVAAPYLARAKEAMRSTANLNFPWPSWFTEVGKEVNDSRWS